MSGSWAKRLANAKNTKFRLGALAAAAVGAVAFFVYLSTLAPTVWTNDAGRFQIAAPILGTGHPTGYPTFILLGKLFTLLPFGDMAYRMNLMAAFFGGLSAGLMFLVAHRIGAGLLPAAGVGLLLAFSATFWAQATVAEVYTMHAAFVLGVTYLLLRWRQEMRPLYLLLAGLLYGLSLGNNAGMALLLPAFLVLAIADRRPSLRLLAGGAAMFLAGLSVYLYVPIRGFAGAWHNYGDPVRTWGEVWTLVSGARFQGLMVSSPFELAEGTGRFLLELSRQAEGLPGIAFALLLVAGGGYGIRTVLALDKPVGIAFLLGLGCTLLYALGYRIADIDVYYIPVYLFLSLFLAVGITSLARKARWMVPLLFLPLAMAALLLFANYPDSDRSGDDIHRERAETTLEQLPGRAILYGKVSVLPVTYLREVEGRREDLTLRWLDGKTLRENLATDLRSGRPVYFVSDARYNEKYLEAARPSARPVEEDGLIRLVPN